MLGSSAMPQLIPAQVLTLKETTIGALMGDDIKRWPAERKTALFPDIIQGKTTLVEAIPSHDLNPSEVEQSVEEGKRDMETPCVPTPWKLRSTTKSSYGSHKKPMRRPCWDWLAGKSLRPCWAAMATTDGRCAAGTGPGWIQGSLVKLCRWFEMP